MNLQPSTTSNPPIPPAASNAGQDLAKKAVCLSLHFHLFGNSKKVPISHMDVKTAEGQVDTVVKKSRLRASKNLLDSVELAAIRSFDSSIDKYVGSVCVPFEAHLRAGLHMVPYVVLPQVEERLVAYEAQRKELVGKFLAAYPARCEEAAKDLNSQYRAADYPTVSEVAQKFGFSWRYVSFGVPENLKGVSQLIWKQERDKAAQRMAEAADEIQLVLRESMAKLVKHMASRLSEDKDGKPLTFHKTAVSNLTEFLGNFDFRNITDDDELQKIVAEARNLLQGADVEQLKQPGTLRSQVQDGIAKIQVQLDGLVVKSGGRKFRFDED